MFSDIWWFFIIVFDFITYSTLQPYKGCRLTNLHPSLMIYLMMPLVIVCCIILYACSETVLVYHFFMIVVNFVIQLHAAWCTALCKSSVSLVILCLLLLSPHIYINLFMKIAPYIVNRNRCITILYYVEKPSAWTNHQKIF